MIGLVRRLALWLPFTVAGGSLAAQIASFQAYCTPGATQSVTQGMQSSNYLQGVVPGCIVTVYSSGTTTLATIYADGNSTPLANPFTATTTGMYSFWGNGVFDVVMSSPAMRTTTISAVTLPATGADATARAAAAAAQQQANAALSAANQGIAAAIAAQNAANAAAAAAMAAQSTANNAATAAGKSVQSVSGGTASGIIITSTGGTNPVLTAAPDASHYMVTTGDQANWNGKVSRTGDTMTGTLIVPGLTMNSGNSGFLLNSATPIGFTTQRITPSGGSLMDNDYELSGVGYHDVANQEALMFWPGSWRVEDRVNGDQRHGVTLEGGNAHIEGVVTLNRPNDYNGGNVTSTSPCPTWLTFGSAYGARGGLAADDTYLYHCNSSGTGWTRIAWQSIP